MDLETKGEEPFANLVRAVFQKQPPQASAAEFPNEGRKVLSFADSRQKAARVARDLQRGVLLDAMRELVVLSLSLSAPDFSLDRLFPRLLLETTNLGIAIFDDGDAVENNPPNYPGSRTHFVQKKKDIYKVAHRYRLSDFQGIVASDDASQDLDHDRPRQYDALLLRLLGDPYYSLESALVGFVSVTDGHLGRLHDRVPNVDIGLLKEIIQVSVRHALGERAFDSRIADDERIRSRAFFSGRGWRKTGGEGLSEEDIIPEYLRPAILAAIGDGQVEDIELAMKSTLGGCRLFENHQDRWFLNPSALTIKLGFDRKWYRCKGCWQFSSMPLLGRCPQKGCNGDLAEVDWSDPHVQARKRLLRDPALEVSKGREKPLVIRAEEHSAQISAKDVQEPFAKNETYELLFQDILVTGSEEDQPVDVLSCTTTMEVGIDIGSLTAVAMRTVPPRPDNYQQRSGRAGRRGTGLSVIITFADNSPHETYYFQNPREIIAVPAAEPIIYVGNEKIVRRHLNAALIHQFFQRPLSSPDLAPVAPLDANLFASLGPTTAFFSGAGTYSFDEFRSWLNRQLSDRGPAIAGLASLLPEALLHELSRADWRFEFIRDSSKRFLTDLEDLRLRYVSGPDTTQDDLLDTLLEEALLPTFSFPIHVCKFVVKELSRVTGRIVTPYTPSIDLGQALSEYVPGRELVIDKKTFVPYGLSLDFAPDLLDRAAAVPWDELPLVNFCTACESAFDMYDSALSERTPVCPVCAHSNTLISFPMYAPEGFAPEVRDNMAVQDVESDFDAPRPTSAKFPVTLQVSTDELVPVPGLVGGKAALFSNRELMVANFGGEEYEGFHACRLCGALSTSGPVRTPHNRPYPKDPRLGQRWRGPCKGTSKQIVLGYRFRTDLTVLRVPIRAPLRLGFGHDSPLSAAAVSLAEALVLAASRHLGIDSSELGGGYRMLPRLPSDPTDAAGNIEFFLFDRTPGGAGFANKVHDALPNIIAVAGALLRSCNCTSSCHTCLRTYENKYHHLQLDRHLALGLLGYMQDGSVPKVQEGRIWFYLEPALKCLQLLDPTLAGIRLSRRPTGGMIEVNGKRLEIEILPALVAGDIATVTLSGTANRVIASEHTLTKDRPRLCYSLLPFARSLVS
jgi:hypothetical protein